MTRKDEILNYIKENRPNELSVLSPLVNDVVFLEERLKELRENPFIEIHPIDKTKQRPTQSAKLYKELLQQYNNCMKTVLVKSGGEDSDDTSPLREFMKQRLK